MKSKAVTLFLSLGLATTLTACGGTADQEGGDTTEPTSPSPEQGEEGGALPTSKMFASAIDASQDSAAILLSSSGEQG